MLSVSSTSSPESNFSRICVQAKYDSVHFMWHHNRPCTCMWTSLWFLVTWKAMVNSLENPVSKTSFLFMSKEKGGRVYSTGPRPASWAGKKKNVPDRSCGWERGGEEWIDLQNTGWSNDPVCTMPGHIRWWGWVRDSTPYNSTQRTMSCIILPTPRDYTFVYVLILLQYTQQSNMLHPSTLHWQL